MWVIQAIAVIILCMVWTIRCICKAYTGDFYDRLVIPADTGLFFALPTLVTINSYASLVFMGLGALSSLSGLLYITITKPFKD